MNVHFRVNITLTNCVGTNEPLIFLSRVNNNVRANCVLCNLSKDQIDPCPIDNDELTKMTVDVTLINALRYLLITSRESR